MLNEGERAPNFTLPTDDGSEFELDQQKGTPIVLYFYPKDNTPGCTTQAIDFSKRLADFHRLGAELVGISPDSLKKHQNFRKKHGLLVRLAADEDKAVAMQYGVWAEKKNFGRTYMGIVRSTFLIDKTGHIAKIWRKVRVKGHVDAVLQALEEL